MVPQQVRWDRSEWTRQQLPLLCAGLIAWTPLDFLPSLVLVLLFLVTSNDLPGVMLNSLGHSSSSIDFFNQTICFQALRSKFRTLTSRLYELEYRSSSCSNRPRVLKESPFNTGNFTTPRSLSLMFTTDEFIVSATVVGAFWGPCEERRSFWVLVLLGSGLHLRS